MDFMDLAKPGEIKSHCEPNALSTFQEYLMDYGSPATRAEGERLIRAILGTMDPRQRRIAAQPLDAVRQGRRDVFL
jgi:2-iminoacetate synthase